MPEKPCWHILRPWHPIRVTNTICTFPIQAIVMAATFTSIVALFFILVIVAHEAVEDARSEFILRNHTQPNNTYLPSFFQVQTHELYRRTAAGLFLWDMKPMPSNPLGSIAFFAVSILDWWLQTWLLYHIQCPLTSRSSGILMTIGVNHWWLTGDC